jgi:hypothetical protein
VPIFPHATHQRKYGTSLDSEGGAKKRAKFHGNLDRRDLSKQSIQSQAGVDVLLLEVIRIPASF